MIDADVQIVTDADRWGYLTGARFVEPKEWTAGLPRRTHRVLHLEALTRALAAAADEQGQLLDFRHDEFHQGSLSKVLRDEYDDPGWKLEYDRFAAMVLTDAMFRLMEAGLLATRGNGDSVDYRLTLPPAKS